MHYTTVSVVLVEGHETQGINDAIAHGLKELSEEINGPVELVNIIPVPLCCDGTYLIVLAKPYQHQNRGCIREELAKLGYSYETFRKSPVEQL